MAFMMMVPWCHDDYDDAATRRLGRRPRAHAGLVRARRRADGLPLQGSAFLLSHSLIQALVQRAA